MYKKWGHSTCICLQLTCGHTEDHSHEVSVTCTAEQFINLAPILNTDVNITRLRVPHILFMMEPEGDTEDLRRILIGDIATDHIRDIILCASTEAKANKQIEFYFTISKQPGFKTSAGKMFKELVLSWLYTHSNCSIPSIAAQSTSSRLKIPACRENNTLFFDSETAVENSIKAKSARPLMLIPTSLAFPTVNAIILTKTCIITVQITLSANHSASNTGFDLIDNHLPSTTKKSKKWQHVFITDNLNKAASL